MPPRSRGESSAGEARRHSPSDGRPAAHAQTTILDRLDAAYAVDLPSSPKAVLVALTRHTDADGRCRPGVARLAAMTGLVERTVRRALGDLEDRELIARWRDRRADGTLSGYRYRVDLAAIGLAAPDVESPPLAPSAGPPPALSAGAPPDSLSGGHERTTGLSVHRPPDSLSAHEGVTPEGEPPPRAPAREAEPVQHPLMAPVREGGEDDDHRQPDEPPEDADPSRDAARALAGRLDLGTRHVPDRLAATIAARLAEGWTVADLARAVTDADPQYGGPLTTLDVGARPSALATRLDRLADVEPPAVRREREAAEERARREAADAQARANAEAHALRDNARQALDPLDDVTRARLRTEAADKLRDEHGIPPGMPVARWRVDVLAAELAEDRGLVECVECDPDRDPIGATA